MLIAAISIDSRIHFISVMVMFSSDYVLEIFGHLGFCFPWQESAVAMVKLLLPQIFEKMSMQEMRTLIAERSTMKTYVSGEIIELRTHVIGFLLEGFVKMLVDKGGLVSYPAMLLPNQLDQSIYSETSGMNKNCLWVILYIFVHFVTFRLVF